MSAPALQDWIDEFQATGRQQWTLRLIIVLAPLASLAAVAAETGRWWPFGLAVVAIFASAAALRPDSFSPIVVIAVVAAHWLATVDRLDTPWLPVAAVGLLVHHGVTALAASFPIGGVVPVATLVRWSQRLALGGGVTVGMWLLVVVFERRAAAGNGLLTALALVLVAGAAIVLRSRSVDDLG